jgi:Raf kinase inhibitor-like YbhB/YbcL family protein
MIRAALFAVTLFAGSSFAPSFAIAQEGLPPPADKPPVNAPEFITETKPVFTLTSTTVLDDRPAPKSFEGNRNGCNGENTSPALAWSGEPDGTGGYALTIFDPDAKPAGFMHWVLLNIPAEAHGIAAGAGDPTINALPNGAMQGENSAGLAAFSGACPPVGSGLHHYEITLYALSPGQLDIPAGITGAALTGLLHDKAVATARLTPTYVRN